MVGSVSSNTSTETTTSKKSSTSLFASTQAETLSAQETTNPLTAVQEQAKLYQDLKMQSMMGLLKADGASSAFGQLGQMGQEFGNALAARMEERQERDQADGSPSGTKFQKELASRSQQGMQEGEGFTIGAFDQVQQEQQQAPAMQYVTRVDTPIEQG